jgi:serine/threonine protein kinase
MDQRATVEGVDSLASGRVVGDYEIESIAGSGGMGIVYRATQRSLGRRVALKVIRAEIAADPEYRARFMREARQAAAVDHPNVVSVYEVGNDDGRLFLAMQWVEGQDLNHVVASKARLPADRAVRIAIQIGGALQAVHEAGLIHRDVKPPNILLRRVGIEDHAYLTDFGVAKPLDSDERFTRSGMVVGTSGYMAPEQIRGEQPLPQTDVYALGCVFFRLLTGQAPFRADSEIALVWAHLNAPRPLPSAAVPELGRSYDEFIAMALAIQPHDRFSGGQAFATALKAAHERRDVEDARDAPTVAGTTMIAPPQTDPATASPVVEPVRARREPTALYPPYPPAAPPPQRPPRARPDGRLALILVTIIALAAIAVGGLAVAGAFTRGSSGTTGGQSQASGAQGTNGAGVAVTVTTSTTPATSPPASSAAKHTTAPPPAGTRKCDPNISANADTSCPFAENVFVAYYDDYKTNGEQSSNSITASSPTTQQSYTLSCTNDGTTVGCSGGNNAFVTFPLWAIQVYSPPQ